MVEYPYLSEKAMRVGTPPFSVFFFPTIKQQIECRADVRIQMYSLKPGTAAAAKLLQLYPTLRPRRRQPTRLPRPWDSPGKNTGVGCHFLFQCMKVKSESEVAQLCPTLSDPMDCSLPGSSIHRIFQARVLEWGAIAFSAGGTSGCLFPKIPLCCLATKPFSTVSE